MATPHMTTAGAGAGGRTQQTQQSSGFTTGAIIALGIAFWIWSQNATGEARSVLNLLLFTLLVSMVLLNWQNIRPLIFRG